MNLRKIAHDALQVVQRIPIWIGFALLLTFFTSEGAFARFSPPVRFLLLLLCNGVLTYALTKLTKPIVGIVTLLVTRKKAAK